MIVAHRCVLDVSAHYSTLHRDYRRVAEDPERESTVISVQNGQKDTLLLPCSSCFSQKDENVADSRCGTGIITVEQVSRLPTGFTWVSTHCWTEVTVFSAQNGEKVAHSLPSSLLVLPGFPHFRTLSALSCLSAAF